MMKMCSMPDRGLETKDDAPVPCVFTIMCPILANDAPRAFCVFVCGRMAVAVVIRFDRALCPNAMIHPNELEICLFRCC